MTEVSADLFAADYSGTASPLEDSWGRAWQDPLSEAGGFTVNLQNDDAALADCAFGKVVRFSLDAAPVFAGIIEAKTVHGVAQVEADEYTELKGRGTMALTDSFVVFPEVAGTLVGDTRYFNVASGYYDDSGWAAALTDVLSSGQGEPPNWPAPSALKISQVYDADTNAPAGFNWFRKTITIPSDDLYRIHFSADDTVTMWIDGVLVVSHTDIIGKTSQSVDIRLTAGDHLFAVEVENYTGGLINFIWFMFGLYALEQDGTLGTLLAVSDATWKAYGFGPPPGFTPGNVLTILSDEADARGVTLPALDFDADVDTDGTPWPVSPDIAFRVGLKGLAALLQLAETYADLAMDPETLTLRAWAKGAKGAASAVVFDPDSNVLEMSHEVSG